MVRVPGRLMTLRPHGKAGFAHLAGGGEQLQVCVRLDAVGESGTSNSLDCSTWVT